MFYNPRMRRRPQYLEDTCKTALNRVPEASRVPFRWTVNPYRGCTHSCHYCFARAFHTYLDMDVGDDFASKIVVKTNVADVLRRELASPKWEGEPVAMGTATDPYQHCEGRYRLTRGVVEAFADFENPLSMLTKSTMIVRDLDVFARLAAVAEVTVSMSVGMLDEGVRRVVEPGTPPGRKRLEILSRFADAGIRTGVLVAPILPGLTDDDEHLDEVLAACAEVGVAYASPIVLHVRASIRDYVMPWLRETYPWLYPRYVELYGGRAYAPKAYQQEVGERFDRLRLRHGIGGGAGRPVAGSRERGQLALSV
ncbi:MAG: radical SAM protein [Actinobacteria bacterium]|nr:MAG: radical SAM protein [Actinomycetota bacterium]